jgi:glycosyltransferase involved in cell wall biosynthesis
VGITHSQTSLVLTGRLRALREAGFRVILLSSPGTLFDKTAQREGVESIAIPMKRGISPFADLVSLFRIARVLRRLQPAVTEFSTPKAGLLGSIAAFLTGVPHRIYLLRGLRLETSSPRQRWLLTCAERIAAACSHKVLCNSRSLSSQTLALGLAPARKLALLGHGSSIGVDVERFAPGSQRARSSLGLPENVPVIGFVGRLTRDKGIPELIEAFESILRAVPEARLLLVGWFDKSEDALSADLRARIDAHPRIVRTGFVADTAPCYHAMDVMVLPTWREGFPNVVLEAAASGLPVITTTATGARDAVIAGVTGVLIPPGRPAAIADAVIELIADPARRARMGAAARAWVSENFVHERMLGLTVAFYQNLLQQSAPAHAAAFTMDAAVAAD